MVILETNSLKRLGICIEKARDQAKLETKRKKKEPFRFDV
jgi:hypothetical protein